MYDEKCLRQIGGNVKYLRSVCHITQQDLAARIGISQTHLCNLEHDHARISMKLLLRIANTLGCALEVLLDTKAAVAWGENRDCLLYTSPSQKWKRLRKKKQQAIRWKKCACCCKYCSPAKARPV